MGQVSCPFEYSCGAEWLVVEGESHVPGGKSDGRSKAADLDSEGTQVPGLGLSGAQTEADV